MIGKSAADSGAQNSSHHQGRPDKTYDVRRHVEHRNDERHRNAERKKDKPV